MTDSRSQTADSSVLSAEVVHLGEDDPTDLSFAALLGFLLRHLRLLVLGPFLAGAAGMVLGLLFLRAYTAESQFVPENGGQGALGTYASLAASAGVSLPGVSGSDSPEFYAALLKSPAMLRKLAESRFTFDDDGEMIDAKFVEISGIERPTHHRTMLGVIKLLEGVVQVKPDALTGLVEVRTTAASVPLAEQMNRRLLELVNEFNDERRRQIASAERIFVEGRLAETARDVQAAEDSVRRFLERNRGYQGSPQLVLELDRLRRGLTLRQQVYTGLAQSLENARIEEVRNTPQITIVTPPEGTADRTRLLKYIVLFAVLGGVLSLLLAFVIEWMSREVARRPGDYELLRTLTLRDLYAEIVGRGARG